MSKDEAAESKSGEKLLTAVERILAEDGELIGTTEKHIRGTPAKDGETEDAWRLRVAQQIVSEFSTRSAISGGAAALPAIVPGFGTLMALVGGALADMALMLKFEVEMALCLSQLYGYDLRRKRERQLAFLLASVSTYDARSNQNFLVDLARAEGTALWNYTPRQLSKAILSVMTKMVLLTASKSFARVLPVVGVVVGASANKVLTRRVGERCTSELARRAELERPAKKDEPEKTKVKATVKSEGKTQTKTQARKRKASEG